MNRIRRARKKSKEIGRIGENTAARMFQRIGCGILVRNCRTKNAEIDMIVLDGDTLVFAEIKTLYRYVRRNGSEKELHPRENLKIRQEKRILRGAHEYLRELGYPDIPIRFDVVEVIINKWGPEKIFHHFSAFKQETVRLKQHDIFRNMVTSQSKCNI